MNIPTTRAKVGKDKASEALRLSPIPALRHLVVEEQPGRLVISGRLPSYYFKQLAQETVLPYLGGRELLNQVIVAAKG
ncbi:MAG TPA: BON domain-containing protein [Gemmatales bacterium]|nr:BON domain-containing protein [Gemmatales bacterium]HMP58364.1 BON domain-containing protein [Gemmatales bacterium]